MGGGHALVMAVYQSGACISQGWDRCWPCALIMHGWGVVMSVHACHSWWRVVVVHGWGIVVCAGWSSMGGGEGGCSGPWVLSLGCRLWALGVARGCWVPFVGAGRRSWALGRL